MAKSSAVAKMCMSTLKLKSFKENVKVDLKLSGRQLFMMVLTMEEGLASSDQDGLLREVLTDEDRHGLVEVVKELLAKGGFEDFYADFKEMAKG